MLYSCMYFYWRTAVLMGLYLFRRSGGVAESMGFVLFAEGEEYEYLMDVPVV